MTSRRPARTTTLALALLLALPLLSGCVRAQLSIGVSSDDRVSGRLVLAVPRGGTPPTVTAPPALGSAVTVKPYSQGGYNGSEVQFTNLSFAQVQQLSSLTAAGTGAYSLNLRRSGDIVTLEGTVDLTSVTPQGADVELRLNFPARVATTNGIRDGANGVTWSSSGSLTVGRSNLVQASARYPDPASRTFTDWTLLVGGFVLGVALLVGLLALLARDRSPRPGRTRTRT